MPGQSAARNAKVTSLIVAVILFSVVSILSVTRSISGHDDGNNPHHEDLAHMPEHDEDTAAKRSAILSKEKLQDLKQKLKSAKETNDSHLQDGQKTSPKKIPSEEAESKTESSNANNKDNDSKHETTKEPMNILLLYADDWSFTTLGAMGNKVVKTPNLDKMASNGMLFTHNCVTTSICYVSRANLYTGQYASRHQTFHLWDNLTMLEPQNWKDALYPQLMANGYHVGLFGKWHHSETDIPHKEVPTFSAFITYPWEHIVKRHGKLMHITTCNKLDGLRFLRRRPRHKPFALTISFFATHAEDGSVHQYRPMNETEHLYANQTIPRPKTLTEKHWQDLPHFFDKRNFGRSRFMERYKTDEMYQDMMTKTYRMASEVDSACGDLLQLLEEQGILNNTLVIFTTDNGNMHGEHGLAEKWFAFEESIRVPLIIMDPRMPADQVGKKNSEFTLSIDLAPTILAAANIPVPQRMQGRDIAPLYLDPQKAEAEWRKEFWYEFYTPPVGLRATGREKKVKMAVHRLPSNLALVRKDRKYMYWPDYDLEQVFNLEQDPFEEYDVYNTTPKAVVLELRDRMKELQVQATAGDPM